MSAVARSLRPDIRNPVLKLPAIAKLQQLDEPTRALLSELLLEIQGEARTTAEKCWRKHKAPMASYWKAVIPGRISKRNGLWSVPHVHDVRSQPDGR